MEPALNLGTSDEPAIKVAILWYRGTVDVVGGYLDVLARTSFSVTKSMFPVIEYICVRAQDEYLFDVPLWVIALVSFCPAGLVPTTLNYADR